MRSPSARDSLRLASTAGIAVCALGAISVLAATHLWLASVDQVSCPDVDGEQGSASVSWGGGSWCHYPTQGTQDAEIEAFDLRDPWWSAAGFVVLSSVVLLIAVALDRAVARHLRRPALPRSGPILAQRGSGGRDTG